MIPIEKLREILNMKTLPKGLPEIIAEELLALREAAAKGMPSADECMSWFGKGGSLGVVRNIEQRDLIHEAQKAELREELKEATEYSQVFSDAANHNAEMTRKAASERDGLRAYALKLRRALQALLDFAQSDACRAVDMSAYIHGVKYRPEDVECWDVARIVAALPIPGSESREVEK